MFIMFDKTLININNVVDIKVKDGVLEIVTVNSSYSIKDTEENINKLYNNIHKNLVKRGLIIW